MSCRTDGISVLVVFTAFDDWAFPERCSGGEGLSYMASDHLKVLLKDMEDARTINGKTWNCQCHTCNILLI